MPSATALIGATLILLPAALRWAWGRALIRHLDDPALPERLLANQRRSQLVLFICIVPILYGRLVNPLWGLPALVVARGVAGYPLRKRLFGETWSLVAYLSFFGRLLIAVYGFWILLLNTPMLVGWFGRFDWLAAIAVGAVLVAWNERAIEIIRWSLRARPIADPELLARFEQMAAVACGGRQPHFEYVDMGGGALANAVALPSLRRSGVVFTSTLLALLDREETVAICAHELAHLEYYDRRRLQRGRFVNIGLISLAVASGLLWRAASASATWSWFTELPLVLAVAFTLIWRAKDRQKNETASDLRALSLCGNADALARGLTKLYAFARVPRRWDAERERQATHPSLARRIRDIRAADATMPAPVVHSSTFAGTDGRSKVTFDDVRVEWQENEGITHGISYAHLSELRIQAGTSGPPKLVAVEKTGRRWEMPVDSKDVAAIQSVLDSVDSRLASVTPPRVGPVVVRIAAIMCASLSISTGQVAAALISLLAVSRPQANLLIATGVAAIASALLALRDTSPELASVPVAIASIMMVVGSGLLLLARLNRRDEAESTSAKPIAIMAIVAALLLAGLVLGGVNPVRLHQHAVDLPATALVPLALAAALLTDRRRRVRLMAIVSATVGGLVAAIGSTTFLDYVARDPFLVAAGPAIIQTVETEPSAELEPTFEVSGIRLSPGGRSIAVRQYEYYDENDDSTQAQPSTFHVGPVDGPLHTVAAHDLVFVDDAHALAVTFANGSAEVREVAVADAAATLWRASVTGATSGTLQVDTNRDEWQLLGWTRSRHVVRAAGRIGADSSIRTEWQTPPDNYGWTQGLIARGPDAVYVNNSYDLPPFSTPVLSVLYDAAQTRTESRVWHLTNQAHSLAALSRLDVNCTTNNFTGDALVCSAYDGARTRLVTIDPATAAVTPASTFYGRFRQIDTAPGWVTGWLNSTPVALRLASNVAFRLASRPREWIRAVAASDAAIATASYTGGRTIVRVYPLAGRSAQR